ncbi:MAG: GYD domain-containing protein [Betaproteobacteria bacterium]
MATYIVLSNFAGAGFRGRMDSVARAQAVRDMARNIGSCVRHIYWTTGSHDVVAVVDAPDAEWVAAATLALGRAGHVRTQVLQVQRDELAGMFA